MKSVPWKNWTRFFIMNDHQRVWVSKPDYWPGIISPYWSIHWPTVIVPICATEANDIAPGGMNILCRVYSYQTDHIFGASPDWGNASSSFLLQDSISNLPRGKLTVKSSQPAFTTSHLAWSLPQSFLRAFQNIPSAMRGRNNGVNALTIAFFEQTFAIL